MKKALHIILPVLFIIFGINGTSAQKYKIDERSSKKMPSWVYSSQTDYLVALAIGPDIDELRRKCLDDIRMQMIRSVAENVKFSSSSTVSQQSVNSEMIGFLDNYFSVFETQGADVAYLTGVSASKIADTYWEKRRDKTTGKIDYIYAIKYPFPSIELKKLVREFEKKDEQMYVKYLELENGFNDIATVEQISRAITDLDDLAAYFFDDTRRRAALTLQVKYRQLYDGIMFREISNEPGRYEFGMLLDGNPVKTSQRPVLSSDVASQLRFADEGDSYVVYYDYLGSEYGEENSVSVRFNFGGKPVTHKFYYTIQKTRINLYPEKTAYLSAKQAEVNALHNISVVMDINSGYSGFTVRSLRLTVPGLAETIFMENINQAFTGRNVTLKTVYEGEAGMLKPLGRKQNMMGGRLTVDIPGVGEGIAIDFNIPFQPNW